MKATSSTTAKVSQGTEPKENEKIVSMLRKRTHSLDQKMFKSLKSVGNDRKEERYNL